VWEREFHEATTLIENREAEIERVSEKLEQNLVLLGATAIEDRLQDGVPEAIADLKRAGLKVRAFHRRAANCVLNRSMQIWVATGDKLETAIGARARHSSFARSLTHAFPSLQPSEKPVTSSHAT
jgi:phospholipid-translocating ATPase